MRWKFLTTMTAVYEILGIPCFISGISKPSLLNGHFWPFKFSKFWHPICRGVREDLGRNSLFDY